MGMISRHNVTVLVQRPRDPGDKTLVISPGIGLDQTLLACLLLLLLAHERQGWKADLSRDKVPPTPPDGPHAPGPAGRQPDQEHGPGTGSGHGQQPAPGAGGGGDGGAGQEPPAKRHKSHAPGSQGEGGGCPATEPAASMQPVQEVVEVGSNGSNGSSTSHADPGAYASPNPLNPMWPQLCSFASVGLTGQVISGTSYGKVLQVRASQHGTAV